MKMRLEQLIIREPNVLRWQHKLTQSLHFISEVQAITFNLSEALTTITRAVEIRDQLATADPANQLWLISQLSIKVQHARVLIAMGETDDAQQILEQARLQLQALVAAEPTAQKYTRILAASLRLEASLRFPTEISIAQQLNDRALTLGETLVETDRSDRWSIYEYAQAQLLAGYLATDHADLMQVQAHWHAALSALPADWSDSHDWRLLEPGIHALLKLDRTTESHPLVTRLHRFGYHSFDPLAASVLEAAFPPHGSTQNP